jgi:hypothetical protein
MIESQVGVGAGEEMGKKSVESSLFCGHKVKGKGLREKVN